jgi:nucleoside-diphosphate-sugar epimerase
VRAPSPEAVARGEAVRFQLGEEVSPEVCAGAEVLVHCAYDFRASRWEEIEKVNVRGAERLFAAARTAGVRRITAISTMSAFPGCVSLYGKAKLAMEEHARAAGAAILRPGLIYGSAAGAMFGRLVEQTRKARFLPLIGGSAVLYLVHERDLSGWIERWSSGNEPPPATALTAAHPRGWTFRALLEALAAAQGRRLTFVPVPWRAVWLALKTAETLGVRLSFRSDSLVSLVNQNPHPDFTANASHGLICREFNAAAALASEEPPRAG